MEDTVPGDDKVIALVTDEAADIIDEKSFLGMVLDIIGITVLLAPIFVPVITSLGFDPLWFGVIFNLNLQIAYLSPPFGYSMFYLKAVAPPDVTMTDLYRSVLPYMALQLIGMVLCMLFPQIVLWLPNLMIK